MANDTDMLLKLGDAIKGESTKQGFENWIYIDSFSFGAHNNSSVSSGVATKVSAGKGGITGLSLSKWFDLSSPDLLDHCVRGALIPKAQFIVRRATGKQEIYVQIDMANVLITSCGPTGAGSEIRESLTLDMSAYVVNYWAAKALPDGTDGNGAKNFKGYDFAKGVPASAV